MTHEKFHSVLDLCSAFEREEIKCHGRFSAQYTFNLSFPLYDSCDIATKHHAHAIAGGNDVLLYIEMMDHEAHI